MDGVLRNSMSKLSLRPLGEQDARSQLGLTSITYGADAWITAEIVRRLDRLIDLCCYAPYSSTLSGIVIQFVIEANLEDAYKRAMRLGEDWAFERGHPEYIGCMRGVPRGLWHGKGLAEVKAAFSGVVTCALKDLTEFVADKRVDLDLQKLRGDYAKVVRIFTTEDPNTPWDEAPQVDDPKIVERLRYYNEKYPVKQERDAIKPPPLSSSRSLMSSLYDNISDSGLNPEGPMLWEFFFEGNDEKSHEKFAAFLQEDLGYELVTPGGPHQMLHVRKVDALTESGLAQREEELSAFATAFGLNYDGFEAGPIK